MAIIGLVTRFHAPVAASPRTRDHPPPGYGTAEQCLPFTAAAALGLTIPSPFAWGFCRPDEVPEGGRAFRSPVPGGCRQRVFYVRDDPALAFARNQFAVPEAIRARAGSAPIPGLSFFDREDQQDHVKLHLPYIWRTAEGVALLFSAPLNRPRGDGLEVVAGLVECDWYASPVNLVLRLPASPREAVHVAAGETIAQAIPVAASLRRPRLEIVEDHRREARDLFSELGQWREKHERDRAAYKRLAKSRHGTLPDADG